MTEHYNNLFSVDPPYTQDIVSDDHFNDMEITRDVEPKEKETTKKRKKEKSEKRSSRKSERKRKERKIDDCDTDPVKQKSQKGEQSNSDLPDHAPIITSDEPIQIDQTPVVESQDSSPLAEVVSEPVSELTPQPTPEPQAPPKLSKPPKEKLIRIQRDLSASKRLKFHKNSVKISTNSMKRVVRRAGVVHKYNDIYEEGRIQMRAFITGILLLALHITSGSNKKIVTKQAILEAAKYRGFRYYG